MNKKWKIRRGFINMHVTVDIKTKILSLDITREDTHDNKKFKDLVDKIDNDIEEVYADGAYDSNIKVRSNSIIKGNNIRDMHVLDQLNDYTRWKYKHDYGKRFDR